MKNKEKCLKCGKESPCTLEYFCKSKSCRNGIYLVCKICNHKYQKEYREKHKEYIQNKKKEYREKNVGKIKEHRKEYRKRNLDKIKARAKAYHRKNSRKICNKVKQYYRSHRVERIKYTVIYHATRIKNDLEYKLLCGLRTRLCSIFRTLGVRKCNRTLNLLGCSPKELRTYLCSKFKRGMTWNNYGRFGWHIDHIIPCASFDLTKAEEQKRCFHYTNLQPLWAKDNLSKNSFYNGKYIRKGE